MKENLPEFTILSIHIKFDFRTLDVFGVGNVAKIVDTVARAEGRGTATGALDNERSRVTG